jgi:hypothetical protein
MIEFVLIPEYLEKNNCKQHKKLRYLLSELKSEIKKLKISNDGGDELSLWELHSGRKYNGLMKKGYTYIKNFPSYEVLDNIMVVFLQLNKVFKSILSGSRGCSRISFLCKKSNLATAEQLRHNLDKKFFGD